MCTTASSRQPLTPDDQEDAYDPFGHWEVPSDQFMHLYNSPETEEVIRTVIKRAENMKVMDDDKLDDVEQEMRIYIWQKLDNFNPEKNTWRGFVFHLCYDRMRNYKRDTYRRLKRMKPIRDMGKDFDLDDLTREEAEVRARADELFRDHALDEYNTLHEMIELLSIHSEARVAKEMGIPRRQIRKIIEDMRAILARRQAG